MEWLSSEGIEVSNKLTIGQSSRRCGGRGVICTTPIDQSEVLVVLPKKSTLSLETAVNATNPFSNDSFQTWWKRHTNSTVRLAAVAAWERERFGPYIDMFPDLAEKEALCMWDDADLALLPPSLGTRARSRKATLDSACADLEALGLSDKVPKEVFLRANEGIVSRAFAGQASTSSRVMLSASALALAGSAAAAVSGSIPLELAVAGGATAAAACGAYAFATENTAVLSLLPMIDQVNHAGGPAPDLNFDTLNDRFELRANRNFQAGEEVLFSYGPKDSDLLLLQHGFVEEDNPSDCVEMELPSGISSSSQALVTELGVVKLRLKRGGDAELIGAESSKVPEDVLAEIVNAALPAAILEAATTGDAEVRRKASTPERAELICQWRAERRRVLDEARSRWGAS